MLKMLISPKKLFFLKQIFSILFFSSIITNNFCWAHSNESPYCVSSLENINSRNHFVSDNIDDVTGGFELQIEPVDMNVPSNEEDTDNDNNDIEEEKLETRINLSTEFNIKLISHNPNYDFIKGILLYVENVNQTMVTSDDAEYNLRLGHFVNYNREYFKPLSCGILSPPNSTLQHFNANIKKLPQVFTWSIPNVFDYEEEMEAVIKATVVVTLKEWGIPVPLKFKPKKIIMEKYPKAYLQYQIDHMSFIKLQLYRLNNYYHENPFLFVFIIIFTLLCIIYMIKRITKKIKRRFKHNKYRKLHNIRNPIPTLDIKTY